MKCTNCPIFQSTNSENGKKNAVTFSVIVGTTDSNMRIKMAI